MIRRAVALTVLTTALLFAVPTPSHAVHLSGAVLNGPVVAADLMTQAWSWVEKLLGVPAQPSRSAGVQKDVIVFPPPPPTGGSQGGSGSAVDPDGKSH
jgi:hypothetical protein